MGRSPTLVEDQVTYPIVSGLVSAPRVADVRGYSMFGMSFVYVIFEEGTDIYWARSRVLEYLDSLDDRLPPGVDAQARPGRHGRGLGLPVRAGGRVRAARPRRAAHLPGLHAALRARERAGRGRGGQRGRLPEAVPGDGGPGPAARLRRDPRGGHRPHPRLQRRRGRPGGGDVRSASTTCAAAATCSSSATWRRWPSGPAAPAACRCCCATSARCASARTSGAACWSGTATARRWAASW